jgi:hypothetical protein
MWFYRFHFGRQIIKIRFQSITPVENKNVDILFHPHGALLENLSSGTITITGGLLVPVVSHVSGQCFGWIDISADKLLVPEGTIHPVVNVSVLTRVIRYIHIYY